MADYDIILKRQILRLNFNLKLRDFVDFLFLRCKTLQSLIDWIEIVQKLPKYEKQTEFFEFLKHFATLPNNSTNIDVFLRNVGIRVRDYDVPDDLIIDMLRFIDLKNYE